MKKWLIFDIKKLTAKVARQIVEDRKKNIPSHLEEVLRGIKSAAMRGSNYYQPGGSISMSNEDVKYLRNMGYDVEPGGHSIIQVNGIDMQQYRIPTIRW